MAIGDTARLIASLELKDQFTGPAKKIDGSITGLDKHLGTLGTKAHTVGTQIGSGIKIGAAVAATGIAVLASQVAAGLGSLVELERIGAQTDAVLKSTGGAAGITAGQVRNLAEKFEGLNATIDDKVIQSTENLLLTFTSIKGEAFEPALQAILDMNTAMGGGEEGLQTTAIQVGKALQDPIKGITALRKVGVNFSADQIKVIKKLVETGDTLAAQKLILKELNTEFGGSFLAQGNTTAGKVAKVSDSIEDLQKALATALLPALGTVADKLTTFLQDPATVKGIQDLGRDIAGIFSKENIDKGAKVIGDTFQTIKDALPTLKEVASSVGDVIGTAVGLFQSLPPDLQKLAIGALAVNKLTGGAITSVVTGIAGLALSALKTITAAEVTVIGGTVVTPGGVGNLLPGAAGAAGAAGGVGAAAAGVSAGAIVAAIVGSAALVGVVGVLIAKVAHEAHPELFLDPNAPSKPPAPSDATRTARGLPTLEEQQKTTAALTALGLQEQRQGERVNSAASTLATKTQTTIDKLEAIRALRQVAPTVNVNLSTTVKTNVFGTTATTTTTYNRFLPGGITVV